eukprot:3343038-Rhodomonas_salina.4
MQINILLSIVGAGLATWILARCTTPPSHCQHQTWHSTHVSVSRYRIPRCSSAKPGSDTASHEKTVTPWRKRQRVPNRAGFGPSVSRPSLPRYVPTRVLHTVRY